MPQWGIFQWLNQARQQARLKRLEAKERRLRELLAEKGHYTPEKIDDLIGCASYLWLSDEDRDWFVERSGYSREELESNMKHGLLMMFQYKDVAELVIGDKDKAAHEHLAALQWLVSLQHGQPDES